MSNVVRLPGAAPTPVRQKKKSVGHWGDRERINAPNTMPDGRKRIRLKIGEDSDGAPLYKNFTGRTLGEAKSKRDQYIADQAQTAAAPVITTAEPMRVSQWADRWYLTYAGDDKLGVKKSVLKKIKTALGDMRLDDVTQEDIQRFANATIKSKSHVSKIKSAVQGIFETAVDNGHIEKTPVVKIKWATTGETGHRALEKWERDFITENWMRCGAAGIGAMLMMYTGERPGEARAQHTQRIGDTEILVRDSSYFDQSGRMILQPDAVKTEAGFRDVPIVSQLRDMLSDIKRHDNLIWLSARGAMMSQSAATQNWRAFLHALRCLQAGIKPNKIGNFSGVRIDKMNDEDRAAFDALFEDFTPYTMRHTFCTMLYEADIDLKTAQYLMGHNDAETTLRIYTHLSGEKKQSGLDKMLANLGK